MGGEILEGWERVSVTIARNTIASKFGFKFSETSPGDPLARLIRKGVPAEIFLAGTSILSGRVTERRLRYGAQFNDLEAAGRDVLGDIVDSSTTVQPSQWRSARVETIVEKILSPFPLIQFRKDLSDDAGSVADFTIQTGEKVFASIDRLARLKGLIPQPDGRGGLYLIRPRQDRAPVVLVYGENILQGNSVDSENGRHSSVTVHGQGSNSDFWNAGSPGQSVKAEAFDPGITRSRPRVIIAENGASETELRIRARTEVATAAARSSPVEYTVEGWEMGGYRWKPGDLIPVYDAAAEIGTSKGSPAEMELASVTFSAGANSGPKTTLRLMRPGAFTTAELAKPSDPESLQWER